MFSGKYARWGLATAGVLLTAAFPALFLYFRNAGEAHFSDIAVVLLCFMMAGIVLFILAAILTRNAEKAGIIAVVVLLASLNYAAIETLVIDVIPSLYYWHIMPVICTVLMGIAFLIHKKLSEDLAKIIMPVLCTVFLALTVINGLTAIPTIIRRTNAEREAKKQAEWQVSSSAYMPNFYFLLFDEYSTIPFMQKYFHYDNSEFLVRLENLGFNVSQSGHNDDARTAVVMTNMFQLDYVVDGGDASEELFELRSNNKVFPLLRKAGYSIVSPAGSSFYGLPDALGGSREAETIGGENARSILLSQTVFYPFTTQNSLGSAQKIYDQLNYFKKIENKGEKIQFTLAHFILPHTPFLFNADGTVLKESKDDWEDLNYYLHQYQFTTKEMLTIVEHIVEKDPDSVIWLLSDHSARANMTRDFRYEDMRNFFNAVYYRGEKMNIEGLSGVNTFRLLLNQLLNTDLEMIPLPAGK